VRTRNLDRCLEHFAEHADRHRYSVAWVDCLARGRNLGRSVVMTGDDAGLAELPRALREKPLEVPHKRSLQVPVFAPGAILNPWSVSALNAAYWATHRDGRQVVDMDSYFYPLDSILNWNRVYGRRGFIQYQALLPPESSRRGLIELLEAIAEARAASFLAVLKTTGAANPAPLSFLRPGHTLALDLPNTGERLIHLTQRLDEILLRHGGRLYLAKDAMTSAEAFAAMYPELPEFRRLKDRVDPNRRFLSSQARRLGIVEAS
jgi:decaprenylphospho-beta-D-ribofuranose 2-oxidase